MRAVLIWCAICAALLLLGLFARSLEGPKQGMIIMGLLATLSMGLLVRIFRGRA